MLRFLSQLARPFHTATRARAPRRTPRRATLGLEGLEDRLVLSTATLTGSTLLVNASPGFFKPAGPGLPFVAHFRTISFQEDSVNHARLDVIDSGKVLTLLGKFPIASIKTVDINVAGLDSVKVDASNGLPFASGTTVSLSGSGSFNSLTLTGSHGIKGGETYTAGNGAQPGSLTLRGTTYEFTNTIGSVTDSLKTTLPLVVKAFGQNVSLSGSDGVRQTLSGLSVGGAGDNLTFSNKASVDLRMDSRANANATLNASAVASRLQTVTVDLLGNNDTATISSTPSRVSTIVNTFAQQNRVNLRANRGLVTINGNSSATLIVGSNDTNFSQSVTAGIQNNVAVRNLGTFFLEDEGNVTTREVMRVTASEIFGSGMFGQNSVVLSYFNTSPIIVTGRLANNYIVAPAQSGDHFTAPIVIDQFSNAGIAVSVSVDAGSGLHLSVFNEADVFNLGAANGFLAVSAVNGTINPRIPTIPDGEDVITFAGGLTSQVVYRGFDHVTNS
jgi:hypothetical protein